MKRLFIFPILVLLAWCGTANAQEHTVSVHSNGQTVYSSSTSGNNRINFEGSNAIFTHNGNSWTTLVSNIDSMTFSTASPSGDDGSDSDTVAVDTTGAIRITWNGTSVSVLNPFANQGVSIATDGGNVSVTSTIDSAYLPYVLKGSSANGSLTLNTLRKVLLCLDGVSLTSGDGAAIAVTSDKKAVLHLTGSNSLSDATGGSHKGALQAQGKLSFQGTGTLNVSGLSKHGIQSSGRCTVLGGTVNVLTAVKDGMNVDDFIMYGGTVSVVNPNGDGIDGDQGHIAIYGGSVTVNCSADDAKGICCDSTLTIGGGTVDVTVSGDASKALKTKENLIISGGTITIAATGSYLSETVDGATELSYCTGMKAGGYLLIIGGDITVNCPSGNAGGKALSSDGDITIADGTLNLTAVGACNRYLVSGSTYDSYSSTCIKADGDVSISGGTIVANAGGRAISCDGNYSQSGGHITATTTAAGFGVVGSGSSFTDGFAAACLKVDGNITFTAGTFNGSSTGKAGRGIRGKGTLTFGATGTDDDALHVYVTTSGPPFSTSTSSTAWRGLPKGIKIEGNITVNSGHLQSYCAQTSSSTSNNTTATNGFHVKNSSGTAVMTYKWPSFSGSGFESTETEMLYNGPKPPPGPGGGGDNGEAIETKANLYINGGFVEANALDDAINATSYIQITGGHVWAYARGNDGMDCNGTRIDISGGTVICRGTEVAIDDNGDRGGKLYVTGGTLVLIGGSMGTTEATPSLTNQKSLTIGSSSGWGGGARVYISSPNIQSGTYTYFTSPTISGGTSWHGLYSGATVTTSGNGTSVTAQ